MKNAKTISITLLILIGLLIFSFSRFQSNGKQINLFRYSKDLVEGEIKLNECVVQVIQIKRDSIFIDTCYATYNELLQEFEKYGDSVKINFNRLKIEKHLAIQKTNSIFNELYKIPTNKLKQMEKEINGIGCDSAPGIDIEVVQGNNVELIELRDLGSCHHAYSRFIKDVKTELNQKTENWY